MTKKNLVMITQHFYPEQGATAQLMNDVAEGLQNRDINVKVLTMASNKHKEQLDDIEVHYPKNTLRGEKSSNRIQHKVVNGIFFFYHSLIWCYRNTDKGDKLLIASNPPFIGLLGVVLKLTKSTNYIFIFQDIFPRSAILSGTIKKNSLVAIALNGIMRLTCRYASYTIVLSESMKERFYKDIGRLKTLRVIPNWSIVKHDGSVRTNNLFAKKYSFANYFTVQYSGNFGRLHDIETILRAATDLKTMPVRFVFIGGGFKEKIIKEYITINNSGNIRCYPYQDRSLLSQSLEACDLAVISLIPGAEDTVSPSKFYGIIASGRGVLLISEKNSDLAQLIEQYNCGILIKPGDSLSLAKTINLLAQQPNRVSQMGRNALKLYLDKFGKDKSIDSYASLIEGK